MKMKHTPAPWELHIHRYPNGKLSGPPYIYAPKGRDTHRHICQPFIDDNASAEIQAEQEANARLLAGAATTPKIEFVCNCFSSERDRDGNTYTAFDLLDTRTGRSVHGIDVPASNLREAIKILSGGEWRGNYVFNEITMARRRFDKWSSGLRYIGSSPEQIAEAFRAEVAREEIKP